MTGADANLRFRPEEPVDALADADRELEFEFESAALAMASSATATGIAAVAQVVIPSIRWCAGSDSSRSVKDDD